MIPGSVRHDDPQGDATTRAERRRPTRTFVLALACAAVFVVGWHLRDSRLPSPLLPSAAQRHADESRALPVAAWAAPLAGTPFAPAVQPHAWLGRVVLALSPDHIAPRALRATSAVLLAAFVTLLALALHSVGCVEAAALALPIVLVCAGAFRFPDAAAVSVALDAALLSLALLGLVRTRAGDGPLWPSVSIGALSLAVADQPAWLLVAIPWGGYLYSTLREGVEGRGPAASGRRRVIVALSVAVIAACVLGAVGTVQTYRRTPATPRMSAPAPGPSDEARATFLGPLSVMPRPVRQERSAAAAMAMAAGWWRTLGLVGTLLAIAGFAHLLSAREKCAWLFAGAPLAVLAAVAFRVPSDTAAVAAPALVGAAGCAAIGVQQLFMARGSRMRAAGYVRARSFGGGARHALPGTRGESGRRPRGLRSTDILVSLSEPGCNRRRGIGRRIKCCCSRWPGRPRRDPSRPFASRGRPGRSRPSGRAASRRLPSNGAARRSRREASRFLLSNSRIRSLVDYVATLPAGSMVAIAAGSNANREGAQPVAPVAVLVGGHPAPRWPPGAVCLLGAAGAPSGALAATGAPTATLIAHGGDRLEGTRFYLPGTLTVSAGEQSASIALDWRWRVETNGGLAVAVFDTAGNLLDRQAAGGADSYSVVSHTPRTMLFRVQ